MGPCSLMRQRAIPAERSPSPLWRLPLLCSLEPPHAILSLIVTHQSAPLGTGYPERRRDLSCLSL